MPITSTPTAVARSSSAIARSSAAPRATTLAAALLAIAFAAALAFVAPARADDALPAPSPALSPEEVVEIVIDALRTNEGTADDAGIRTVWRFASPGNRASTGPLPRFARMIKRGFPDMLAHESSRFDEMRVVDDKALQAVWLTLPSGNEVGYAFQLGRQEGGEYDGMWMTEAVLPLGEGARSGTRI